jgi:CRP-like cAMP-binding protein
MPAASDTIDQARALIEKRLSELDDERKKLEGTLRDLGGRRGSGRPRGSGGGGRKRRRRRGGTRAEQAVKVIQENPGITPSQIAERLGIKPNYMYRVMNELQRDKLVRKKGRGYFAR